MVQRVKGRPWAVPEYENFVHACERILGLKGDATFKQTIRYVSEVCDLTKVSKS